jgi:protein-L-isoaspartate O-methyltransferase
LETAETHQRQLFERIRFANRENPISQPTENAYLQVPRHLFLSRYRLPGSKDWQEVRADNLGEHLRTLYADGPLILSGDDDGNIASTISQPSLVLRMLDLMQLEQGQKIFELGAGSGWNAALMGHRVGPTGHVHSLEIIPEVAKASSRRVLTTSPGISINKSRTMGYSW